MHDGHPFMLYGYVSVASNQIKLAKEQIEKKGGPKSCIYL